MMRHWSWAVTLAVLFLLSACSSTPEYARVRAFYRCANVAGAPALMHALAPNSGVFCTIRFSGSMSYVDYMNTAGERSRQNLSAADKSYGMPQFIAGFIVGQLPTATLSGKGLVAYDLVCPNCYASSFIQRSLEFSTQDATLVHCSRCRRIYSLANEGAVVENAQSEKDKKLYQYHIQYGNNAMVITN
jgi:putative lipoprotein|nr:hypothetical protein [uncultured Alloprevotella sp.]